MRRNKKKNTRMILLILLLLIGIGFAALAANLKINGTVNIDSASWDVHFENVQVTQGSVTANPAPTSDDSTTTEMTYAINFEKPGDFFEFTVDIANDGSIDAMVNLISNETYESDGTTPKNLPSYLKSTITYNDGIPIAQNQLLEHETSEKIKVRIEYKTDINPTDLPETADTVVFKFSGTFKQKDSNACPKPTTFANDSWDTIACNVKQNPLIYPVGAEKTIEMDLNNDQTNETYTVRVANNTTPSECSTTGFSQTACGFVVEFKELITKHRMNPSENTGVNGDGNKGGWEYSEMRTYVNSNIYNALPSDLKTKIINTTVVSGYGNKDANNFTTTDKLYLLSPHEIWETVEGNVWELERYDKAYNNTRQLDYYNKEGVTVVDGTYSSAEKKQNGSSYPWWTRSAYSTSSFDTGIAFYVAGYSGNCNYGGAQSSMGVSPAFRIG